MWQAVILQLPMGDWKQQELWYFHVNQKQSFVMIFFFFLKHFIPHGPSGWVAPAIEWQITGWHAVKNLENEKCYPIFQTEQKQH